MFRVLFITSCLSIYAFTSIGQTDFRNQLIGVSVQVVQTKYQIKQAQESDSLVNELQQGSQFVQLNVPFYFGVSKQLSIYAKPGVSDNQFKVSSLLTTSRYTYHLYYLQLPLGISYQTDREMVNVGVEAGIQTGFSLKQRQTIKGFSKSDRSTQVVDLNANKLLVSANINAFLLVDLDEKHCLKFGAVLQNNLTNTFEGVHERKTPRVGGFVSLLWKM